MGPIGCSEASVTNYQSTWHKIPEEADLITTREMPAITHRTRFFPLDFPGTFAYKFPTTNFISESLLPHTCCCIHPNNITPTWQSTNVFTAQLNPDIPTAVLLKIPNLLISHMTSRLLSKQIRACCLEGQSSSSI